MNHLKLMKQQVVLLFSVLLLSSFLSSARLRVTTQGEREVKVKINDDAIAHSSAELNDDMELMELMGSEECDEEDEECFSRRMIAEAHLDYIYTQHHKP